MSRWVHGLSKDILRAAFREYFGVSDEHVDILIVLYARPGEWTPLKRLQVLLDSHRPPKRQAVYERIRVLREAMDPESLLSGGQMDELAEGYALSEVGYAECAKALRALIDALHRAGPKVAIPPPDGATRSPITAMDADRLLSAVQELETGRPEAPSGYARPAAQATRNVRSAIGARQKDEAA